MELLSYLSCIPCLPSSPYIKLGNKSYRINKLLGEGGFSYIYLVTDSNNSLFAIKRIKCLFSENDEFYKFAINELKNYKKFIRFKSPYIIQSIDEDIIQEYDGSRTINILLPYFEKSLQDIINFNVLNNQLMSEVDILKIFIGTCRGLQIMHKFKQVKNQNFDSDHQEQDFLLNQEDEEGEEELDRIEMEELIPYAHRDIKPANIMISAEGLPVLIDLGSTMKARVNVKNSQQAMSLMDFFAQNCTLPYRPPELFEIEVNDKITEATDIWSLGCLLYCCCFGTSPFEKIEIDKGANLMFAIKTCNYFIPEHNYSPQLIQIINDCLNLDPLKRPSIDSLIEGCLKLSR